MEPPTFDEFSLRVGVLAAVLGLFALADWAVHGRRAKRWREYVFLLGCAELGAAFGVGVDQITARLSPEYFIIGKHIEPGEGYWTSVMQLGVQAGFFAGAVVGGLLLIANSVAPSRQPLRLIVLARFLLVPIGLAIAGACQGGLVLALCPPPSFMVDKFRSQLEATALFRLCIVWGIHLGLYIGGVAGTVFAVACVVIKRSPRVATARDADCAVAKN